MKSTLLTLFITALTLVFHPKEAKKDNNVVVLELFTSQGCSSCPPADQLLNKVKSDKVIALSYHVDYWDYIGWKDPFGKSEYSDKQRLYASKFNSSTIYTPQLVINGKEHMVGSDKLRLGQKVSNHSKIESVNSVSISNVSKQEQLVKFNYNVNGDLTNKYIRTVLVINGRTTYVKRGENRNRKLVNTNIVVNELRFKLETNSGLGSVVIPEIVESADDLSLIVIIENGDLDITGASQKLL